MKIKSSELAWMAGVFEGEGSIRINGVYSNSWACLICDLVSTDAQMVEPFQRYWPGHYKQYVKHRQANRKDFWRWRIAAVRAESFLMTIQPHFRTDRVRRKAALALEFQGQKINGHPACRSTSYKECQIAYFEQMKALNAR